MKTLGDDDTERRVQGSFVVVVLALLAFGVGAMTLYYLKREDVKPIPVPASQPATR